MKTCKDCKKEKPVEEFASAGVIKGVQYYRKRCKSCYYQFKQIRKNKLRKIFVEFKKQFFCVECGESDIRVLDFDHLDPSEKSFNLGDAIRRGYSFDRIKEEVAKCQVLCANCHRKKTFDSWCNTIQGVA